MNKNSSIWITGASSGIGKETTKEFARIGCKVTASSRRHSVLEMINKELCEENLCVDIVPCNVASPANVEQTAKKIIRTNGIDCLVNNAGITSFKPAEEDDLKEIIEIININLIGAVSCIKAVLPYMIEKKSGTIINVLSTAAIKVFENNSAYSASKAGLRAYSNVLREEVRKHNIKIINILPGAVKTNMWNHETVGKYGDRMMQPAEIARTIVSLFLQDKSIVTEEVILRSIGGDI